MKYWCMIQSSQTFKTLAKLQKPIIKHRMLYDSITQEVQSKQIHRDWN
jgi:acid stress-induced BolA-like protein IbaG/YrbA